MKFSTKAQATVLAKAVTRANLHEQRAKELALDLIHVSMERDAAVAEARALRTELAEVKAHYRLAEAELALAKAAYAGVVAKLGADDQTDLTNAADEAWLRLGWADKEVA